MSINIALAKENIYNVIIYYNINKGKALKNFHSKTYNMILIALFAALMALGAWISVPFAIPFTMQSFVVFASLLILGGKRGLISICVYIAAGLVGAPVFSGFCGGPVVLMSVTGGYIIGFVAAGITYCLFEKIALKRKKYQYFLLFICLAVCYLCAVLWYAFVYSSKTMSGAFVACVLPFIVPDVVKIGLAVKLKSILKFKI